MWKNWIPFRRKPKENADSASLKSGTSNGSGKENTHDVDERGTGRTSTEDSTGMTINRYKSSQTFNGTKYADKHPVATSKTTKNGLQHSSSDFDSQSQDNIEELDDGLFQPLDISNRHQLSQVSGYSGIRSRTGMGLHDKLNTSLPGTRRTKSPRRPITSPLTDYTPKLSIMSSMKVRSGNQSFSGVHGPLLSTPLVPKVRRALETSAGLRSPQVMSSQGKPVGRSASLNYGTNPAKSTAGQIPWVRLKRRESIGLADIVSGNTPQSPNTVKLAAPDQRHLPAAPSFRTTPLIVTTEPSRARVVDTQTVVSALREKRKRFGPNPQEEVISEDAWINAAKRRRQDSSQSNASSVSIPPMPEALPNLMGTPGTSLLHIENLTDQRPSTVPAVDAFITHHQRDQGLGGDRGIRSQQHAYSPQQQPQDQVAGNKNNSKSVLRSIQSSLSSSLRARTNLTMLQQSGVDLKRIRQMSQNQDTTRRMSFSSDITMADQSFEEPPVKKSVPAPEPAQSVATSQSSEAEAVTVSTPSATNSTTTSGTVMTPIKRKIAEGVVLRKHNLSMGASGSPAKPAKVLPVSALVSTNDFERDRQKEYQRRVLDMLENEESSDKPVSSSDDSAASTTSTVTVAGSVAPVTSTVSQATALAPSTAAPVAISSTLDSLNKLVQSATTPLNPSSSAPTGVSVGGSVSTANTLSQLLKSDEGTATPSGQQPASTAALTLTGKPLGSPSSAVATSTQPAFTGFSTTDTSSQAPITTPAPTPLSAARGLNFNAPASAAPQCSVTVTPSSGFKINFSAPTCSTISFGNVSSPAAFGNVSSPAAATLTATTSTTQPSLPASVGFSFGLPTGQAITSTTSATSATASVFTGTPQVSTQGTQALAGSSGIQFGITPSPATTQPGSQPSQQGSRGSAVSFLEANTKPGSAVFSPSSFSFTSSTPQQQVTSLQAATGNAQPGQTTSTAPGTSISAPSVNFNFGGSALSTSTGVLATEGTVAPTFALGAVTTSSQAASFNFGQSSTASQPSFNFSSGTLTAPAAVTKTTTAIPSGFVFGASNTATTTASQPQVGFNFSVAQTVANAANTGNSATAGLSSTAPSGFPSQTSTLSFGGFGLNQQTTNAMGFTGSSTSSFGAMPSQAVTSASSQPPVASVFGASAAQSTQPNPQAFGATSDPPAYSPFGGTTTTATALPSAATFNYGQTATTAPAAKPFTFGAATAQPNPSPFGGVARSTATPAPSIFGSGTATTTAPSIFGSSTAPGFSNTAATTPFGSSVPTTSPPAFGSAAGMSTFGVATSATNQTASIFGSATPSSNQPFAFGIGVQQQQQQQQQPQQQQTSAFGATPSPAFGAMASTGGVSLFGGKPGAPAFGTPTASAGPVFGAPSQTATTTAPSMFGSSFGGTTAFGGASSQQSKPFGAATPTAFGTAPAPTFGATTQNSLFGTANQNTASPFGAQANANQTPNPSPFGNPASAGNVNLFGAAKPNPFGATASTQAGFNFSAGQPQQSNTFGTQPTNLGSAGFNFGQTATQPAAAASSTGGFNFAAQSPARPTFQAPTPGGFNFTAAAGAGPFNFSGTPGTPNMFTPATPQSAPRPRATARRPARKGGVRR